MSEKIDLHVHIDPKNPREAFSIIDSAKRNEIIAIGLLSKVNIDNQFPALIAYGKKNALDVIPGLEVAVEVDGASVDIIALGFDPKNGSIVDYFGAESNIQRNKLIVNLQLEFLETRGLRIVPQNESEEKLFNELLSGSVATKAAILCELAVANNQNSQIIDSLIGSQSGDRDEAKLLYKELFALGKEGYNYVFGKIHPRSAESVIDTIHKGGGIVLYSPEGHFTLKIWEELSALGIDGIMGWHAGKLGESKGKSYISKSVMVQAHKRGMLVLGGSDFQNKDWELGVGEGNMFVSKRRYQEFLDYIKRKNNGRLPWLNED